MPGMRAPCNAASLRRTIESPPLASGTEARCHLHILTYEACHIIHVINQEKGCLARGERGRWVGQRAAATAGPPARTPAAEAGEGE